MDPNKRTLFVATLALALIVPAAVAQPKFAGTPFSADMAITARQQRGMVNGKLYAGEGKWRMDMEMQGQQAIMIFDAASQVGYMLMPAQKMYMEVHADRPGMGPQMPKAKPMDPTNPCAAEADMTCTKVGKETVNGRSTERWEITSKKDSGNSYTAWIDDKLHFPIKTASSAGDSMELTNIQEGSQPATLFEVPPDFKKFGMGGMAPGMPR
jgi:hypothetical protein